VINLIDYATDDSLREVYLMETRGLVGKAEQLIINRENIIDFDNFCNEIFRIMHTIKSSSWMVRCNPNANLANSVEDLFYYIREEKLAIEDNTAVINIVLESNSFLTTELKKIESGQEATGDPSPLINKIHMYLDSLKIN
jgi:two-component system chemotaxis sensor kinase CheA